MNLNLPWCIYSTKHISGFYYNGKGQTEKVMAGTYQGSGIRFKLALLLPEYKKETWHTQILDTFEKEEDAFTAEAALVTLESLADPFCLNMHQGGSNGKYQTHGKLLAKIAKEKRAINKKIKTDKAKARIIKEKAQLKELKRQLKEK